MRRELWRRRGLLAKAMTKNLLALFSFDYIFAVVTGKEYMGGLSTRQYAILTIGQAFSDIVQLLLVPNYPMHEEE